MRSAEKKQKLKAKAKIEELEIIGESVGYVLEINKNLDKASINSIVNSLMGRLIREEIVVGDSALLDWVVRHERKIERYLNKRKATGNVISISECINAVDITKIYMIFDANGIESEEMLYGELPLLITSNEIDCKTFKELRE